MYAFEQTGYVRVSILPRVRPTNVNGSRSQDCIMASAFVNVIGPTAPVLYTCMQTAAVASSFATLCLLEVVVTC